MSDQLMEAVTPVKKYTGPLQDTRRFQSILKKQLAGAKEQRIKDLRQMEKEMIREDYKEELEAKAHKVEQLTQILTAVVPQSCRDPGYDEAKEQHEAEEFVKRGGKVFSLPAETSSTTNSKSVAFAVETDKDDDFIPGTPENEMPSKWIDQSAKEKKVLKLLKEKMRKSASMQFKRKMTAFMGETREFLCTLRMDIMTNRTMIEGCSSEINNLRSGGVFDVKCILEKLKVQVADLEKNLVEKGYVNDEVENSMEEFIEEDSVADSEYFPDDEEFGRFVGEAEEQVKKPKKRKRQSKFIM